jgi:hypothetical protein
MNYIEFELYPPKIVVISRHCNYSSVSANKPRPDWFSRENCYSQLIKTKPNDCEVIILFDGEIPPDHFLNKIGGYDSIVEERLGSEANSFLRSLEIAISLKEDENTIVYFVEDDYWHLQNWGSAIREGFCLNTDYLTLYDHPDSYMRNENTQIQVSPNYLWKFALSTTNTYAVKLKTLREDIDIHVKYSSDLAVNYLTNDYQKFLELNSNSRKLINPIPAISTHCESYFLSPTVKWEEKANV